MSVLEHLHRAIELCGSQQALAKQIGLSQQGVSYLLKARTVSAETAVAIERATNGAVSRRDLRPDLFSDSPAPSQEAAA